MDGIKNAVATTAVGTIGYYVSQYSALAAKTAKSTLEMCKIVYEAKHGLGKQFEKFCATIGRKETDSTIRKYLAIGEAYPRLIAYADQLPNAWTSIYLITQISAETFDDLISKRQNLRNLTGHEVKKLSGCESNYVQSTKKAQPSALIFFKKEPTVPEWNYFKVVLNKVIHETSQLDLYFEITPKYKNLIKEIKKVNRVEAKARRKAAEIAQKQVDERNVNYRPDLFDYGDAFDVNKGDYVSNEIKELNELAE